MAHGAALPYAPPCSPTLRSVSVPRRSPTRPSISAQRALRPQVNPHPPGPTLLPTPGPPSATTPNPVATSRMAQYRLVFPYISLSPPPTRPSSPLSICISPPPPPRIFLLPYLTKTLCCRWRVAGPAVGRGIDRGRGLYDAPSLPPNTQVSIPLPHTHTCQQ